MWFDISVNQNLWPEEPPSAKGRCVLLGPCHPFVTLDLLIEKRCIEKNPWVSSWSRINLQYPCHDVMIQWCNDMQWCKCMIFSFNVIQWLLIIDYWWQSEACNQTLYIFDSQGLRSGVVLGRPGTTPWDSRNSPKGCFFPRPNTF